MDLLISHRLSAVPVVNRCEKVIGVVSEADLMHKVEADGAQPRVFASLRRRARQAKAAGRTAGEVMSTPAVTVASSMSIAAAARRMRDENVKLLPVVDEADTLVGIVSRADLLKVHLRSDAQIRRDVVEQILGLGLGDAGSTVQVTTTDGVVTLRGWLNFRSTVRDGPLGRCSCASSSPSRQDSWTLIRSLAAGRARGRPRTRRPARPRSPERPGRIGSRRARSRRFCTAIPTSPTPR
jgi:predicted transcriptional regulator